MQDHKLPPYSIEAEMGCIGSILLDTERNVIPDIVLAVKTEDFFREQHRIVFQILIDLYDQDKPIDIITLRDKLKAANKLDKIGGVEFLMSLVEAVPSPSTGPYYAGIVRKHAIARQLISIGSQMMQDAYDPSVEVSELLERSEVKLLNLSQANQSSQTVHVSETIPLVVDQIAMRDSNKLGGLKTGYLQLDQLTSGFQPGELVIIAARPSMGKTAFCLNCIEYMALTGKHKVAIFSLEMSKEQLLERMVSSVSKVVHYQIRNGFVDEEQQWAINIAGGDLAGSEIWINDDSRITPLELRSISRRLKHKHGIDAIFIDYLQLMSVGGKRSRLEEIGFISRQLKHLARELNIPVICVSQLNRQAESREGHKPRLSDLRESGDIEQDADTILLLFREDYYNRYDPKYNFTNLAEVIIGKQRQGPLGNVSLVWDGSLMKFKNLLQKVDDGK